MEFTGERIVPGSVNADLLNEHLCRYRFAQLLVKDKVVLDIGSGVGYGAKILAEKASAVVAVDLSEEAVRYANEEYAGDNIEMVVADGHGLPLASDSVDVVVSFELIEHLQGQQAHLHEVNRVLKPNGLTVISTPNRIFYSQESNQANPFHTHEFDFQEFLAFLKSVFSSVQIYFQNHIAGLIIGNPTLFQEVTACLQEEVANLEATSNFFVGVCTHGLDNQPRLGNFCLLPGSGNLLRERQQNIQRLEKEVRKLDRALTRLQGEYRERTNWALQLDQQVKRRDEALARLRDEFEDRSRWVEELSRRLEARDKTQLKLRSEFEDRNRWAEELSRQLEARDKAQLKLRSEFEDRNRWAEELSRQLEARDKAQLKLRSEFEDRNRWAEELSLQLEARDKAQLKLQSEFEDRNRWAEELSRRLEARDKAQLKLQSEFEDRTEWALRLDAEVQRLDAEVQRLDAEVQQACLKLEAIRQSRLYKLAKLLGLRLKV